MKQQDKDMSIIHHITIKQNGVIIMEKKSLEKFKIIIPVAIILAIIIGIIAYKSIFITLPFNAKIKSDDDFVITRSQEKLLIEYYKDMAKYYNGIVTKKYSLDEIPDKCLDAWEELEEEKDSIWDEEEHAEYVLNSSRAMWMHSQINGIIAEYNNRILDEGEAKKEIKKEIKEAIKENLR